MPTTGIKTKRNVERWMKDGDQQEKAEARTKTKVIGTNLNGQFCAYYKGCIIVVII